MEAPADVYNDPTKLVLIVFQKTCCTSRPSRAKTFIIFNSDGVIGYFIYFRIEAGERKGSGVCKNWKF